MLLWDQAQIQIYFDSEIPFVYFYPCKLPCPCIVSLFLCVNFNFVSNSLLFYISAPSSCPVSLTLQTKTHSRLLVVVKEEESDGDPSPRGISIAQVPSAYQPYDPREHGEAEEGAYNYGVAYGSEYYHPNYPAPQPVAPDDPLLEADGATELRSPGVHRSSRSLAETAEDTAAAAQEHHVGPKGDLKPADLHWACG